MIKNLFQNCLMLIALLFASCNQSPKKVNPAPEKITSEPVASQSVVHNSSNSLDWAGTYKGTLPCADCEGLETEVFLKADLTYPIKTKYLGKGNEIIEEKGNFNWNNAGNTIVLSGNKNRPNQYFVGENKLIQLDMSGKKIEGTLADNYVLKKVQN